MTAVSFAVMAHPLRTQQMHALLGNLPLLTTWAHLADIDTPGDVWGTARRAWGQTGEADMRRDWHVVLQDDAILADDFVEAARAALSARGSEDCVVSFFSFADSTKKTSGRWLELTGNTLYAVALAMPVRLVRPMLDWTHEHEARGERTLGWGASPKTRHDDKRILDWAKAHKYSCYVTVPNIVDHDPGPSIANPKSRPRVSANFMRVGAARLDWTDLSATKVRK